MDAFIDRNFDHPWSLEPRPLARLVAMGGLRRLAPKVGSYLKDPRTRRLLSFQAMYAGLSPYDALAIYAVISYLDSVAGVYFPRGGMQAVPRALAAAAEPARESSIRYGAGGQPGRRARRARAAASILDGGERLPADAVVLTPDAPGRLPRAAPRRRLRAGSGTHRLPRQKYSPSCFLLLAGSSRALSGRGAPHHLLRTRLAPHLHRAHRPRTS